jgi:hypothetical protein
MSNQLNWLADIQALNEEDRHRLITYARTLSSYPRKAITSELLSEFGDKIGRDDLDSMRRAIEIGGERLAAGGW